MGKKQSTILILIAAAVVILYSSVYVVNEWQQVVIVQLGKIVGNPVQKPGFHFKAPFIQEVRYFEKRILTWDGKPEMVPTADKKYIFLDTTARWRIIDPRRFYETVQREEIAMQRINSIIEGKAKNIISNHNLVETVRNTNNIIHELEELSKPQYTEEGTLIDNLEDKISSGEIETIALGREKLANMITESAREEVNTLGIELIDVLIRRIAYEPGVESKVFERMVSERRRIAEKIRSIGKGEEARIKGKLNLDLKSIESEAYRRSQEIKGVAEAEAITIYAEALKGDPGFYAFSRTMEAYKKSIPGRANFIISTESEFFKALNSGNQ